MFKSDPNNPNSVSAKARAKRTRQFVQFILEKRISNAAVLDIGGTAEFWKMHAEHIQDGLIKSIDVVNLPPQDARTEIVGSVKLNIYGGDALDARTLSLDHYDIVHSNSVIEHVGNLKNQLEMANNVMNISQYYWVQTPAKYFPLEPHFYFPFFSYLPLFARTRLHQYLSLGFMKGEPDWLKARIECEEIRLLTKRELKALFPGGVLLKEVVFGLVKSRIATNITKSS
jgi:hypothetical protein